MFDTARSNSVLFQCDQTFSYKDIALNNNEVNGCGMPGFAKFYYILYQIIVSQVFLNLFIAVVVDTFIGMKRSHNLPVTQLDIDIFVDLWKKYDPMATGYIETENFELFLEDLCAADT